MQVHLDEVSEEVNKSDADSSSLDEEKFFKPKPKEKKAGRARGRGEGGGRGRKRAKSPSLKAGVRERAPRREKASTPTSAGAVPRLGANHNSASTSASSVPLVEDASSSSTSATTDRRVRGKVESSCPAQRHRSAAGLRGGLG